MLWIAICIYVLKICQNLEIIFWDHFFYWPFDLHRTHTTNDNTNTKTRQNETLFPNKVRFSDALLVSYKMIQRQRMQDTLTWWGHTMLLLFVTHGDIATKFSPSFRFWLQVVKLLALIFWVHVYIAMQLTCEFICSSLLTSFEFIFKVIFEAERTDPSQNQNQNRSTKFFVGLPQPVYAFVSNMSGTLNRW